MEAKHRLNLNMPYLVQMVDWAVETKSDFCSTNHRVTEFWAATNQDLGKEIKKRGTAGGHFTDQELTYILFNATHAVASLNDNKLNHKEITPTYIDLGNPGQFDYKVIERGNRYEPFKQVAYNNHAMGKLQYLSPEIFQRINQISKHDPNFNIDVPKCDAFSLGMTLLRTGTMSSLRDCYDYDNFKFLPHVLQSHLENFKQRYNDNPLLCESLSQLLMVNPADRWNLQYLRSELPPIEEIKDYYEDYETDPLAPAGFSQQNISAVAPPAPIAQQPVNALPSQPPFGVPPIPAHRAAGNPAPLSGSRRNYNSYSNLPQSNRIPSNRNSNMNSYESGIGNSVISRRAPSARNMSNQIRRSPSQNARPLAYPPQVNAGGNPLNTKLFNEQPMNNGTPFKQNTAPAGVLESKVLNQAPSHGQLPPQAPKVGAPSNQGGNPLQRPQQPASRRQSYNPRTIKPALNYNPGTSQLNRSNYISNPRAIPSTTRNPSVRRNYSTDIRNRSTSRPATQTPYYGNVQRYNANPGRTNPKILTSSYFQNPASSTIRRGQNYPITSKYLNQVTSNPRVPAYANQYNSRPAFGQSTVTSGNPVRIEGTGNFGARRYSAARRPPAAQQPRGATPTINRDRSTSRPAANLSGQKINE